MLANKQTNEFLIKTRMRLIKNRPPTIITINLQKRGIDKQHANI